MCKVQSLFVFPYIYQFVQPITTNQFYNISNTLQKSLCPFAVNFCSLYPQSQATTNLLSVSIYVLCLDILYTWNYNGLLRLASST